MERQQQMQLKRRMHEDDDGDDGKVGILLHPMPEGSWVLSAPK